MNRTTRRILGLTLGLGLMANMAWAGKTPKNWASAPYWVPTAAAVRLYGAAGSEALSTAPMPFFALSPCCLLYTSDAADE